MFHTVFICLIILNLLPFILACLNPTFLLNFDALINCIDSLIIMNSNLNFLHVDNGEKVLKISSESFDWNIILSSIIKEKEDSVDRLVQKGFDI